jgi:hypothetical protein
MARSADSVWVGADGRAYVAPTGTTAPTNATAALSATYKEIGWISEDGIVEGVSEDYNEIKGWDGSVVRKVRTSSDRTLKFTALETNATVLDLFYAGSTVAADGKKITIGSSSSAKKMFVFDVLDGDSICRIVVANGEVTERGDVTHANGEGTAYEFTITAYPDSNGVTMTKLYSNVIDGATVTP